MSHTHKSKEEARIFVQRVADHKGWALNPDEEFLDGIVEGLKTNYNRYGYFLCPCRDGEGDRAADKDIVCPCDYCVPDQKDYGHCFCGLFLTKAFADAAEQGKAEVQPIPERRPEEYYE